MAADDDAPYPNPLDATSGPTTQWTRNNVGEAFPGVVTPLHYDFVVRGGAGHPRRVRGAWRDHRRGSRRVRRRRRTRDGGVQGSSGGQRRHDVRVRRPGVRDRGGRDRVRAAGLRAGGVGAPPVHRPPRLDRRPRPRGTSPHRTAARASTATWSVLAAVDRPDVLADVGRRPRRWQALGPASSRAAVVITHVTTFAGRGVRRAARPPARRPRAGPSYWPASTTGTATPTTTRCRRRCGRSPTATSRWRSSSTNTATRATGPPTLRHRVAGGSRACCGRCSHAMASMPEPDGPEATGRARVPGPHRRRTGAARCAARRGT